MHVFEYVPLDRLRLYLVEIVQATEKDQIRAGYKAGAYGYLSKH